MKMKNEYVAPQITLVGRDFSDIVTVSSDGIDNWIRDAFEALDEETAVLFRR